MKNLVACAVVLLFASNASAQVWVGRDTPKRGSVEISGGAAVAGGKDLPDQNATLTGNPGTGAGNVVLFTADGTIAQGIGGQARAGFYLTSRLALEGGLQYTRPEVRLKLGSDFEDASSVTATERINSYLFTGSLAYHFGNGRLRPFILAGGGHIRDAHDGNEVVETGHEIHAGGGVKAWFGNGRSKFGVRLDLTASSRDGGLGTEDGRRVVPTAAFSLAYLF
jgi:hypothetical protein